MKVQFTKASTSVILTVFIQDSSVTTGAGLAALDQTSNIVGGYVRMGGTGVALAVDENVTTEGTYEAPSAAAKVRIGTPANMRNGTYELHFHNDLFAAGADILTITLGGAANMADLPIEVQLTDIDLNDSVRAGMTALPAAAANAAGGLPTSSGGTLDLDAILADTNELQGDDIPGAISGLNNLATGDLDTALTSIGLDHLVSAAVAGADITDNSVIAKLVSKDATADWDDFVNTTDSLQAIRDKQTDIETDTAEIGAAGIGLTAIADIVWDEVLTGGTHNVSTSAGRRLRGIQEFQGYEDGAIWIDTVNGVAGTTDFENGTVENPVDSIADANALATSLGMNRFRVASGSSITFAASQANDTFVGNNWTLALGGQVANGLTVHGATISGVMAGTGTTQVFRTCLVGVCSLIKGTIMLDCGWSGTHTVVEAGDFIYVHCASTIAGTATPTFDFGATIGNTNLNMRNYSGGVQLEAMGDTGTDTASIEGQGQIIEGTCTGGTVAVRGLFTVSGIANLTLSEEARIDTAQINAEADAALVDVGLDHLLSTSVVGGDIADNSVMAKLVSESATADWDTYNNTTDSLEALRNRGDASWITGGGGGITDLLNITPLIPESIDLANTAVWRLGLMLTNALDDLPSSAEITPGTISIDRKASGGTTWTAVVTDAACSEIDGLIYYDEVFDTGTGYVAGDSLRITFKAQKVTVSANDYEISGATGRVFYTIMKEDMRGTDSAALAAVCTEARLAELAAANLPADIDLVLADTAELQTDDTPAAIAALNNISTAQVNTEVDNAIVTYGLDHLVAASVAGADVVDDSIIAALVSSSGTADWDDFVNTTESLQALRDRGDAAWITGGGGSLTELLNVVPLIPESIDLANTAVWRLGLMLINTLDDLPTTVEITPGTISIDRKASGGTTWTAVVTNAACSEAAGLVYYDEVFDTGTGYVVGDSLRVTFKSQKITVAANDYEVSDATGRIFYTSIREDMRGTDSAALAAVCTAGRLAELDAANLPADIDALTAQIALIEGAGFATGTDSLKQIRDAIDTLVAPSVVGSSALSGSGFLSDCVTLIRQMTDEPSLTPKYTDSDVVERLTSAMTVVMSEVHNNSDHNILCRFDITLVSGQQTYILPPNVGEIWAVRKMSTTTPVTPVYEVWADNHWSSHQSGFVIEYNEFRLLTDWRSTDTLEILYVPNGETYMHKGTATTVTASTLTLAATATDGTLDTRANAYAGYLCRLLTYTEGYVQERIIDSYVNTTRIATLSTDWNPLPAGTMVYEVLPTYSNIIKHCACLLAAMDITESDRRLKKYQAAYLIKIRALRQMIAKKSSRFGGHGIGDTSDNPDRGDFYGWLM